MRGRGERRPSTAATRTRALALVVLLVAGLITVTATVAPAPEAAAATVTIGTIQGQMANHVGVNNGTSGNCIKYAPTGTSSSSALVNSSGEAQTAHGRPGQNSNTCPSSLETDDQSAVGFRPSNVTSAQDGQSFLIGRMIHYNNPVYADDRYFTGQMNTVLGGFTAPNAVTFNWQLDETPNSGGGNCCDDEIVFSNQISDRHADPGRPVLPAGHPRLHSNGAAPRRARRHHRRRDAAERVQHRRGHRRHTPACTPRCPRCAR